jgi:hypothetical protein
MGEVSMKAGSVILAAAMLMAVHAPAFAAEAVTVDNFKRAETHYYMGIRGKSGCFGTLCHDRAPIAVDRQDIIRLNRDTPYSQGVFDLTTPLTVEMPDAGSRFQSLMVINEDHYIKHVSYAPGTYTFTQEQIGSRYLYIGVRTFMDPNDPADMEAGRKLQDAIRITQAEPGKLELPDWDQAQRQGLHDALLGLGPFMPDSARALGDVNEVDPVRHLIATAVGWAGNRMQDALYLMKVVPANDGEKAYKLTVKDVPVDGFWSITVYNAKGFYEAPESAISINNITAKPDEDGGVTLHFGGDPTADNYLRIMPGWNYTVRLYRPRPELLSGEWKFPEAVPAE